MNVGAQLGFQWDEALKIVQRAEDTFNRGDVDAILGRYADDVVIRFAGIPEIRGKAAAEKFLRARFARQKNYRLKKTLFMVRVSRSGRPIQRHGKMRGPADRCSATARSSGNTATASSCCGKPP